MRDKASFDTLMTLVPAHLPGTGCARVMEGRHLSRNQATPLVDGRLLLVGGRANSAVLTSCHWGQLYYTTQARGGANSAQCLRQQFWTTDICMDFCGNTCSSTPMAKTWPLVAGQSRMSPWSLPHSCLLLLWLLLATGRWEKLNLPCAILILDKGLLPHSVFRHGLIQSGLLIGSLSHPPAPEPRVW